MFLSFTKEPLSVSEPAVTSCFYTAVNVSSALFREDQNASNTLLPDEDVDEFVLKALSHVPI